MNETTKPTANRTDASKIRRAGLIFRITAGVFALSAIAYAVNVYRHESADFDISMAVLQLALSIVFFLIGTSLYRKAKAEQQASTRGTVVE